MGKKIIISDEEFNRLPDKKPRSRKTAISQKEFDSLPDEGVEESSIGQTILEGVGTVAEYIDRYTHAPIRAGVAAAQEGKEPFTPAYEQFGEPTESAPTSQELMRTTGISDDVLIEDVPLIGDVTKSGAAGLAFEMATDPLNLLFGGIGALKKGARSIPKIRIALKSRAARNAFKSLAQISSDSKIKEVFNKNRVEIVGQHLLESDLGKHLNNPVAMLERIKGKEITQYTSKKLGKRTIDVPSKGRKGGLISEISNETDDVLRQISPEIEDVDVKVIIDELSTGNVRLRIDPKSAEKFSSKEIAAYDKKLKEFLKPVGKDSADMRSVLDLQAIKKDIGKKLSGKDFFAPTDKKLIAEKAAMLDIYHKLKRTIETAVDGVPVHIGDDVVDAGVLIGSNNQKITSLLDVGSLLENTAAREMRSHSTVQKVTDLLTSAAVGTGTAAATGSTTAGLIAGGAYGASKLGKAVAEKIPSMTANAIDNFITPGMGKATKVLPAASAVRIGGGREPQSVEEAPLAEQLMRTPLPRSSEEAMANKDFVLAKVAQQAPEMFDHVKEVMDNQPESLPEILPALVMAAPNLFTRDKYNRVDGKILDPQLKELATKDTMDNDELSYLNKTLILNKLNKTGQFDDH